VIRCAAVANVTVAEATRRVVEAACVLDGAMFQSKSMPNHSFALTGYFFDLSVALRALDSARKRASGQTRGKR
jgi:hypothetical protein